MGTQRPPDPVSTALPVGRRFLAQELGHHVLELIVGSSPFSSSPTRASHRKRRKGDGGLGHGVTVQIDLIGLVTRAVPRPGIRDARRDLGKG